MSIFMKYSIMRRVFLLTLCAVMIFYPPVVLLAKPIGNVSAGIDLAVNEEMVTVSGASIPENSEEISGELPEAGIHTQVNSLTMEEAAKKIESRSFAGFDNLGVAKVDSYLNIRESPSEDGKLVGKMPKHGGCEILDVEGDWAHIKSGKVEGYVSMEFLYTGLEAKIKAKEVLTLIATVNTTTLKVREEPSTESSINTLIPLGEELEVLEELEEWVKIAIDDEEGYIFKEYVDISEKLEKAVSLTELKFGEGISDIKVSLTEYAKQFIGNPYVWGGTSLTNGADCSGFVLSVFSKFGISLPHSSRAQVGYGRQVSISEAQPGDLFFYGKGNYINHVAIYIGNGQVVHASSEKTGIKVSNATYRTPIAVRRLLEN